MLPTVIMVSDVAFVRFLGRIFLLASDGGHYTISVNNSLKLLLDRRMKLLL